MLKRIAGWGVVVLLLAGLCIFIFRTKQPETNSFRSADGSVISLLDVAYGSNSTYVWGRPYQRTLYKHLPAKLKGYSRVSIFQTPSYITSFPVFWFHESPPTNLSSPSPWPDLNLRLLDEFGCEWDQYGSSSGWAQIGTGFNPSKERISHYQLGAGDPHGKICGVCVYDSTERDKKLATFLIPGCVLDQLPVVRQPMAAPVKVGDMTFELTSLLTGLKSEPFTYSKKTNGVLYSEAEFHITKNGAPAPNWEPIYIKIINAKGKRVSYSEFCRGLRKEDKIHNFAADLNPAEGPFKLRVEFKHWSGFAPDELVTFKDVPFPVEGQSLAPKIEMEAQGQQVILDAIYSRTAEKPADIFQPGQPFIQARFSPTTNSFNLQLTKVVDEKGSEIYRLNMADLGKGVYRFYITPKTKPKSMTLTFAVHHSRFADFEAMPVVVSTNRPAKN